MGEAGAGGDEVFQSLGSGVVAGAGFIIDDMEAVEVGFGIGVSCEELGHVEGGWDC